MGGSGYEEAAVDEYTDPRAHELRKRYVAAFGGPEIPVSVASIAEDLLGLSIHESYEMQCSGILIPVRREIWINAADRTRDRRPRFTLAHELGHWICHVLAGRHAATYCRHGEVGPGEGKALEREANIFAAELLMPAFAVEAAYADCGDPEVAARSLDVSVQAMAWRLFNLGFAPRSPHFDRRSHEG